MAASPTEALLLPKERLDDLIRILQAEGHEVIAPKIEQGAIVYGPIRSASELPQGWTDRQEKGSYRLEKRTDGAYFGYAVGPHSWKKYLFPPVLTLWRARQTEQGFMLDPTDAPPTPRAFLGMRACELHALTIQDRVFLNRPGQVTDSHYARVREQAFLIAVECDSPAATCFCTSMNTGPTVDPTLPYDLALTELEHAFVLRTGSSKGKRLADQLRLTSASTEQISAGAKRIAAAAQNMGRTLDTTDVHNLLHQNQENPHWTNVAERCLACSNCTMVCPTCFCSSVEDVTDLSMQTAERIRRWDSCFNPEFGQVHGGNFRVTTEGRYRQWLTHKFASWIDQFGVSGCTGCGRCITWCPVGIDVTEEIGLIRLNDSRRTAEERTL